MRKIAYTMYIDPADLEKYKTQAARERISMSDWIRQALFIHYRLVQDVPAGDNLETPAILREVIK
jgi:hypothetical protein